MNVLAIDPASLLGWAERHDGRIRSGVEKFHDPHFDGAGARFLRFRHWLESRPRPDAIFYEAVMAHNGTLAAHCYGGFASVIQSFGEVNKIPYLGISVGTIKKSWTGKGVATKQEMIETARLRGFDPKDDNEADALAILHYALEMT